MTNTNHVVTPDRDVYCHSGHHYVTADCIERSPIVVATRKKAICKRCAERVGKRRAEVEARATALAR